MSVRDLHNTMKYEGFVSANSPATTAATVAVADRTGFAAIEYVLTKVAHTATVATLIVALQSGTATSAHALATTADVPLAKARHGRGVDVSSCVEITIKRDGQAGAEVFVVGQKNALSGDDLQQAEAIREAVAKGLENGKSAVLIKAGKGVHWRHIERVKRALAEIEGLENVHLAVEEVR